MASQTKSVEQMLFKQWAGTESEEVTVQRDCLKMLITLSGSVTRELAEPMLSPSTQASKEAILARIRWNAKLMFPSLEVNPTKNDGK